MSTSGTPHDIVLGRLDDQIGWYDKKSQTAQRWYRLLKIISLVSAAIIPFLSALDPEFLSGLGGAKIVVGILGIVVTISEGLQQLNQYHQNWISYRATCEALRHQKYAFLARLGDYATATNPLAILADRIESLISAEHAKWISSQQSQPKEETA